MHDIFETKDISPMLIGHEVEPFDDEDSIYELKLDGIRCLAYIDKNKVILRNKRNKDVTDIYPELSNVYKCSKKECILDGELVVMKEGKPDFFSIQKRSLMNDNFKIKLASKSIAVQMVVFDILYYDNKQLTSLTLMERKNILEKNIIEGNGLTISRYIEKEGIKFFELVKQQELEGIVAKKRDSKYFMGKRTNDWKKIKYMQDEDLIVCGYQIDEDNKIKDLILGYYDKNNKLKCRGKISLGISKKDQEIIRKFSQKNKIIKPWFNKYDNNTIWLKLSLVGTAHYMHKTESGNMRQSVWKGLREDKTPKDCKE